MLRPRALQASILSLLLLASAASAQVFDGVSVVPQGEDVGLMVPPDGSVTVPYEVTIGCGEFIAQGANSLSVALSTDLPAYFGASSPAVTASPGTGCVNPSGEITVTANLVLTPTADAMGRAPTTHTVTATVGSATATYTHEAQTQVDYKDGHTLTPGITFPYQFSDADGDKLRFNVTVDISANSQTMVMFEQISGGIGQVDGLFHYIFDVEAGERQKVYNVVWTPPTGAWENATISFYNYSHCLKGSPCDPTNEANITWVVFNNATRSGGGDGDKDSPGAPVAFVAVAVAAVAVALRRRS